MIERNIYFSEEENSLVISWDPYSHAETHFLVHALTFLFVVFKVVVNKEGLHLCSQGCKYEEGSHASNKYEYLTFFFVINNILNIFLFHKFHIDPYS